MIKLWGEATLLLRQEQREEWQLAIRAGGFSSRHRHARIYNRLQVLSGLVLVRRFDAAHRLLQQVRLQDGCSLELPPGEIHQFQAVTEALVLETCWVEQGGLDDDIERFSVGGIEPGAAAAAECDPVDGDV